MSKFKELMKKLSKNLDDIKKSSQGVESLANIYKKYSEKRIEVVEERLIGMKAKAIYPSLLDKIQDNVKKAIEEAIKKKIKPNEFKSEIANANNKMKELDIRMKSLEKEDNVLKKQIAEKKKEFDDKFKKTQKYMDQTNKISDYYVKNVLDFEKKIESIKEEYDLAIKMDPQALKKDKYAKKRIALFKKYENAYNRLRSFGARNKLNELTEAKDKIGNIRNDLEHFNSEFERLFPRNDDWIKEYESIVKDTTGKFTKSLRTVASNKKELRSILSNIEKCTYIITGQMAVEISQKFMDFKKVIETCISNFDNIDSITRTMETEFFKLTSSARLDLNLHTILTGLKSIEIILKDKVQTYINDEEIPDLSESIT
jgi:chromosome segregation ATPase